MENLDIGIVPFCKKIVARLDVCQIARAVALAWHTSTVQQSIIIREGQNLPTLIRPLSLSLGNGERMSNQSIVSHTPFSTSMH